MKIKLPSDGWGLSALDVRRPTLGDLRKLYLCDYDERSFVSALIRTLLVDKVNFDKVTYWDVNYIYNIVAYSLHSNFVTYNVVCRSCSHEFTHKAILNDFQLITLEQKKPLSQEIDGAIYTFNVLSFANYIKAATYAAGDDNDFYDAVVAFTLNPTLSDTQIESYVKSLGVHVYKAALIYQQFMYHGLKSFQTVKCPSCGEDVTVNIAANKDFFKIDMNTIVKSLAILSGKLSFHDIMALTLYEFNYYVKELNENL